MHQSLQLVAKKLPVRPTRPTGPTLDPTPGSFGTRSKHRIGLRNTMESTGEVSSSDHRGVDHPTHTWILAVMLLVRSLQWFC